MLVRNLLLSTVLTTAVALNASAADATHSLAQKTVKTKKVAQKDDAYSLEVHGNHYVPAPVQTKTEELVVFADIKRNEKEKQDAPLVDNDGLSVKVGGKVDIQYGFINQKEYFKNPANNANLPQYDGKKAGQMNTEGSAFANQQAIVSNGELSFEVEKTVDSCEKYGLNITADANTSPALSGNPNFASKVFIYMENGAGRFEVGANDGASSEMTFSAEKLAKATGGIDGDYTTWIPYGAVGGTNNDMLEDTFLVSPALPYSAQHQKKANKITYYTPTFNGFKAGFSYVPDVTVQGTTYEALSFKGSGYKNVVEGGLSYEHKNDQILFNVSLTGQIGEARDAYIDSTTSQSLKKLGAWQVGGQVAYDSFKVAGSYGDWNASGTVKNPASGTPSKKANFWTAGLAYDYQDKGGASLTYLSSQRRGAYSMSALDYITANQATFDAATQKYEALSLGLEYKVMPGLMPYTEFTSFNYKSDLANVKTNKGSVVLAGIKLNF